MKSQNKRSRIHSLAKHKVRGMTLLEVLVALAIFATAAIAIIRSVSQHINTVSYLEEKMFAAMVADNQMARVILDKQTLRAQNGTEEMAGRTWYWKVVPIPTSQPLLKAFDVSVAISPDSSPIATVRSYVDK